MITGDRGTMLGRRTAFAVMLGEFAKHWERIDVICPRVWGGARPAVPGNVHFHPSASGLWFQPLHIVRRGCTLWAAHRHDRMTVHEYPPFYNGLGAWLLHRRTGIPYTLEVHHVVGHPHPATLVERMGHWLTRIFLHLDCRAAQSVRCVNAATAALLTNLGVPAEKISVVPSFYLDHEMLRPHAGVGKKYDLITCGRLVPNKGIEDVLRALSVLAGRGRRYSLLIVGDGPLRTTLEQCAKALGVASQVTFAGWLPSTEDVVAKLRLSRVFVLGSRSEGGPRSALEAMACGVPVVATPVGVMPEVIVSGENGLLTTGSAADLADKINHLLSHPELQALYGERARKAVARYDKALLISGYTEFLKR